MELKLKPDNNTIETKKLFQLRLFHLIRDNLKYSLVIVEQNMDDLADDLATRGTKYRAEGDIIKPDK